MSDSTGSPQLPRPVWRRAAAAPGGDAAVEPESKQWHCGGPNDLDVEGRYLRMRERRQQRKEAEAREREEAEAAADKARKRDEDEDEEKAAERYRNDRYAVKLLQQDNSAWGGGGAGSGDIG